MSGSKHSEYVAKYRAANRAKVLAANREYNNRQEVKDARFARRLITQFNITLDRYDELLAQQGGGCAICAFECRRGMRLAVDHDHACCPGKTSCGECIRGLLCRDCNVGLGLFMDNPSTLEKAARYLRRNDKERGWLSPPGFTRLPLR